MKNTLVSIIVPCYNQAHYLEEALQSVKMQTYTDWECIIVNDGSLDQTDEIARRWSMEDSRFKYLFQNNKGLSGARNTGIAQAEGIYILPLDADDKIAPGYLKDAVNVLNSSPDVKIVYCKAEKFGNEQGPWVLPPYTPFNMSRTNTIFCSALFKKKDWERVGGYDKKLKAWEDWDLWISILKDGGDVFQLKEVGFYYRINPNSMLRSLSRTTEEQIMSYLSVKHSDYFVTHFGSFHFLNSKNLILEKEFNEKLKSEKFVIDIFCKKFFGFTIFGKYKQ